MGTYAVPCMLRCFCVWATPAHQSGVPSQVHLTNYCLQKHSESFGTHEAGNTISFEDMNAYLAETLPQDGVTPPDWASASSADHSPARDPIAAAWCPAMLSIVQQIEAIVAETGRAAFHAKAAATSVAPQQPVRRSLRDRVAARMAASTSASSGSATVKEKPVLPLRKRQVGHGWLRSATPKGGGG